MTLKHTKTISRIKIDDYLPGYMKNETKFITIAKEKEEDGENEKLSQLVDREADIKLLSKEKLSGVIKGVDRDDEGDLIITITNGDWNNRIKIKLNEIYSMEVSVHPYYSMEHKTALRQIKKPRKEFRYSLDELEQLRNKFVSVNYDGKKIEGQLTKIDFKDKNNAGLTINSDNDEVKFIETYRLRELNVIGDSPIEYKRFKRIRKFENDILNELNYYKNFESELKDSQVNASLLLEKYFEAIIDYHSGEKVNLADYDYDWVNEIEEIKKQSNDWDEVNQEKYEKNLIKAQKMNQFYNERKKFIREVVKKAENINWAEYGISQRKGEMNALKYVYESDVIYN